VLIDKQKVSQACNPALVLKKENHMAHLHILSPVRNRKFKIRKKKRSALETTIKLAVKKKVVILCLFGRGPKQKAGKILNQIDLSSLKTNINKPATK
jgi:hypothetical protein